MCTARVGGRALRGAPLAGAEADAGGCPEPAAAVADGAAEVAATPPGAPALLAPALLAPALPSAPLVGAAGPAVVAAAVGLVLLDALLPDPPQPERATVAETIRASGASRTVFFAGRAKRTDLLGWWFSSGRPHPQ
jgi:hypothetical protein